MPEDTDRLLEEFEEEISRKKARPLPSFSASKVPLPPLSKRDLLLPNRDRPLPNRDLALPNRDLSDPTFRKKPSLEEEPIVAEVEPEEPKADDKEQLRQELIQRIRMILMSRQADKAAQLNRLLASAGAEKDEKLKAIVRKYEEALDSGEFEAPEAPKISEEKKEEPVAVFSYDEKEKKRSDPYAGEDEGDFRGGIYKVADKKPDNVASEEAYHTKDRANVDAKEDLEKMTYGRKKKEEKEEDSPYID